MPAANFKVRDSPLTSPEKYQSATPDSPPHLPPSAFVARYIEQVSTKKAKVLFHSLKPDPDESLPTPAELVENVYIPTPSPAFLADRLIEYTFQILGIATGIIFSVWSVKAYHSINARSMANELALEANKLTVRGIRAGIHRKSNRIVIVLHVERRCEV
ncbi:hypothetical protein R3P38DRAFT_3230838 [Favolaschia claudopus]|uniref:Uncharacterized protein n=1 Tax=Favolaschia claudopus TaxID=2862362 RepID=A0AAV9ZLR1_9AGAR